MVPLDPAAISVVTELVEQHPFLVGVLVAQRLLDVPVHIRRGDLVSAGTMALVLSAGAYGRPDLSAATVGSDATWPKRVGSARTWAMSARQSPPIATAIARSSNTFPGRGLPVVASTAATPRTVRGPDRPCVRSRPAAPHPRARRPLCGGVHVQRRVRTGRLLHRKGAPVLLRMWTSETLILAGESTFPHDQLGPSPITYESGGLAHLVDFLRHHRVRQTGADNRFAAIQNRCADAPANASPETPRPCGPWSCCPSRLPLPACACGGAASTKWPSPARLSSLYRRAVGAFGSRRERENDDGRSATVGAA